jgi:Tol biopolymer transport system component
MRNHRESGWAAGGALALLLVVALTLAACGGSDTSTSPTASPTAAVLPSATPSESTTPLPAPTMSGTIVFIRWGRDEPGGIYTVSTDGADLTRLIPGTLFPWNEMKLYPTWSPDGKRIAFCDGVEKTGTLRLWGAKADASDRRLLLRRQHTDMIQHPSWSPDGKQIVYSEWALCVVSTAGSPHWRNITDSTGSPLNGTEPVWSPNGKIYFLRERRGHHHAICAVDPDGGSVATVTSYEHSLGPFSISPDGKRMAVQDRNANALVLLRTSGQGEPLVLVPGLRALTHPGGFMDNKHEWNVYSSWAPDGSAIVFAGCDPWTGTGSMLYVVNPDGSGLSAVPGVGAWAIQQSWQPQ